MLNEAEVRTQQRVPLPRTASFDTTIARRADPVSGPAAPAAPVEVVDIFVAPSTIVATPPAWPMRGTGPGRLLDRNRTRGSVERPDVSPR